MTKTKLHDIAELRPEFMDRQYQPLDDHQRQA